MKTKEINAIDKIGANLFQLRIELVEIWKRKQWAPIKGNYKKVMTNLYVGKSKNSTKEFANDFSRFAYYIVL